MTISMKRVTPPWKNEKMKKIENVCVDVCVDVCVNPCKHMSKSHQTTECRREIETFVRGGQAGLYRLKLVIRNIFDTYGISDVNEQVEMLKDMGLHAYIATSEGGKKECMWASILLDSRENDGASSSSHRVRGYGKKRY
jgi:hypothetical protein